MSTQVKYSDFQTTARFGSLSNFSSNRNVEFHPSSRKRTLADYATIRRIFYRPNPQRSDILAYIGIFLNIYNSVEDVTKGLGYKVFQGSSHGLVLHVQATNLIRIKVRLAAAPDEYDQNARRPEHEASRWSEVASPDRRRSQRSRHCHGAGRQMGSGNSAKHSSPSRIKGGRYRLISSSEPTRSPSAGPLRSERASSWRPAYRGSQPLDRELRYPSLATPPR